MAAHRLIGFGLLAENRGTQTLHAGVAGGCAGALEAIRACYSVTRPNHRGRANFMACHKHHLRDARKRRGVDARRANLPAGVALAAA